MLTSNSRYNGVRFCKTTLQVVLSAKRFASVLSFRRFTESADYNGVRFCKTTLQVVLSAKRFASVLSFRRFTESADYNGDKNNRPPKIF